jgi:hypothetical protein
VIKPRSVKVIFTTNIIQVFEELRRCNRSFTAIQLIRQLVQTIRYWKIPSFQILEEAIEFYWGATRKFNNWEIFCSKNSFETSSDKMNNDDTKSVVTASATNNEESEQIFDKKNDFNSRKNESWKDSSGWDEQSTNTVTLFYGNLNIDKTLESPISGGISQNNILKKTNMLKEQKDKNRKCPKQSTSNQNFRPILSSGLRPSSTGQASSSGNRIGAGLSDLFNTGRQKNLNDEEQRILYIALMKRAQQFLDNNGQAKEVRIVNFPEFRGGNQDPIEWLEGFERACNAN